MRPLPRSLWGKTAFKRLRHAVKQRCVKPRARRQRRTDGVDHADPNARTLEHGIDHAPVELRLDKDAADPLLGNKIANFGHPRRSGFDRIRHADRTCGLDTEARFVIVIGIVENDKTSRKRRHAVRDLGLKRGQFRLPRRSIGSVAGRILGVEPRQFGRNHIKPDRGIGRIKPSMGIGAGMAVIATSVVGVIIRLVRIMRVSVMALLRVVMRGMIMAFMGVRIMSIGIMLMGAVVMPGVVMGVMRMPLVTFIAVIMRLKACALAEIKPADALGLQQPQPRGIARQRLKRIGQPWRQFRADPNHQIGPLQHRRLRGAQGVSMRRRRGRQHQIGHADPGHHLSHQRMHRRDINRHTRHIGQRRGGQNKRQSGQRDRKRRAHENPRM